MPSRACVAARSGAVILATTCSNCVSIGSRDPNGAELASVDAIRPPSTSARRMTQVFPAVSWVFLAAVVSVPECLGQGDD